MRKQCSDFQIESGKRCDCEICVRGPVVLLRLSSGVCDPQHKKLKVGSHNKVSSFQENRGVLLVFIESCFLVLGSSAYMCIQYPISLSG